MIMFYYMRCEHARHPEDATLWGEVDDFEEEAKVLEPPVDLVDC